VVASPVVASLVVAYPVAALEVASLEVASLEVAYPVEAVGALADQPVGRVAVSPSLLGPSLSASSSGHSSVIYPCAWIA
jgi:hypothetical protein